MEEIYLICGYEHYEPEDLLCIYTGTLEEAKEIASKYARNTEYRHCESIDIYSAVRDPNNNRKFDIGACCRYEVGIKK
jgi:hypothetical protein